MDRESSIIKLGRRTREQIHTVDPALEDWNVFSKTLGWFQFKKKYDFTPDDERAFFLGWEVLGSRDFKE